VQWFCKKMVDSGPIRRRYHLTWAGVLELRYFVELWEAFVVGLAM
jgi:DNA-binding PadR family transcriptional regulator